jgi:probable rRNA maturation factor
VLVARVHIRWERRPSKPAAEQLRAVIAGCVGRLGVRGAEVHLVLTDDRTIQELNMRYRGIDRPTDVLSFPDGDELPSGRQFLGEIMISLDSARRQASELGHDEVRELCELALHGTLHLLGYDHVRDHGEMNDIELNLRRELLP